MAIRETDRKLLWGRSGNRCAICRRLLSANVDGATELLGEEAHIVARSEGGPRGGAPIDGGRDTYANLILLCPTDHARIDKSPERFQEPTLRLIKSDHEHWVMLQLSPRRQAQLLSGLPAAPPRLINRDDEFRELTTLMDGALSAPWPTIAIVRGMHGVGKSTLLAHWAMRHRDRFDVVLTADCSSRRRRGLVDLSEVLADFLRTLGVVGDAMPGSFEDRRTLYVDLSASLATLVVLDDVDHAAQVSSLVPGGAGSLVVASTAFVLEELAYDGADVITLDPFDEPTSGRLLVDIVGVDRVEREPEAVAQLIRACGGLPVALRVCGANLATRDRHRTIASVVDQLERGRPALEAMSGSPEQGIWAILDFAVESLAGEAARVYGLLGLHPPTRVALGDAAAMCGLSIGTTRAVIGELCAASLATEHDDGVVLHEVVRSHAIAVAERTLTDAERNGAVLRLVRWLVGVAQAADRAVVEERLRLGERMARLDDGDLDLPPLATPAEAFAWFVGERDTLLAIVEICALMRWDRESCLLAEALWSFCHDRGDYELWLVACSTGADAADRLADPAMAGRLRSCAARALSDLGDADAADEAMAAAERAAAVADHAWLSASVAEFGAILQMQRGRSADALRGFERSRELHRLVMSPRGIAIQDYLAARCLVDLGLVDEAIVAFDRAYLAFVDAADPVLAARVACARGVALRLQGSTALARVSVALAFTSPHGDVATVDEARAHEVLADLAFDDGDLEEARLEMRHAFEIYRALGHPRSQLLFYTANVEEEGVSGAPYDEL